MPDITKRKESHIKLSRDPASQMQIPNPFDKYPINYNCFPEKDFKKISVGKKLLTKNLNQPLIIASMTGGSDHAKIINTNLAIAAQETKVALGVGSQRIALVKEEARETFALARRNAPDAFLFANIGAVQLNYQVTMDDIHFLIDLINADAIYLHINPLQEVLQPEGDTNFENLLRKIEELNNKCKVPLFVKEVGHGISSQVAKKLFEVGVKNIDVAGAGGTSWAWIEASRRDNENFKSWFRDFGIPTDVCISEINKNRPKDSILIASGGIRSPLDAFKAMQLGADFYSAAKPFLELALKDTPDDLILLINAWEYGLRVLNFVGV